MRSSLWRHRDFLLLWGGGSASDLGSAVSTLLIPLLAVRELGVSTFQAALLVLAQRLPGVVFSLPAGVVVDRLCKRRLMIWCELLSLLAITSVPVAAAVGRVHLWQLYLVAAVVGSLRIFFGVADQSYLPAVLAREQLVDGNAKLNATETAADAAGPALGAALASAFTVSRALAFDAFTYAVSAVTLLLMRTPDPRPDPARAAGPSVGFRAAMTEGLRYVWRDPVLRAISCCTATANLGIFAVVSLEVVYLVRGLHTPSPEVGLVLGVGVLGGFVGSLAARPLAVRVGNARVMWLSLVVCTPFALLMPLSTSGVGLVYYSLGWAIFNGGGAVYQTAQIAYRQSSVPRELLGRVNAGIRWVVWGTMPLGALLGGSLGTWLGLRGALWVATGVLACTGLWLLASPLRGWREIPEPQPA
ncbi:MFS transporter [Streptacidiphilus jiangxiensis]|uniref:Predicted arabinose efflux permease, MFS family n=1 Tax=Streptacidiphilus jiangxiensis TaxID=235985 RepID=A0A1H7JJT4_STRJI|nr:MFS transporter [Streptacidiphilus jiangxiensis]SEK74792.1 Predicted arabinose efflux permease, MFS family [Streptacidiphilus jiangxiensis]